MKYRFSLVINIDYYFSNSYLKQFQSHQIFHVFVIAAAFVHYHGITEMAMHRMTIGDCSDPTQVITF